MSMKCGLATPEWASKHEFHVVLTLCRSLAESPSGESRVETLWRTILGDTSLDGQHPAPRGLAENFRIFVTVFAGIYILKAGLHGRDETAVRDAIASALNELKCGSELPSIEDVDKYLDLLKSTGGQVPGTQDYTLYMQQMIEIDDAGSPFLSEIHLIATARRFFTAGRGNLGLGPTSCLPNDQVWFISNSHVPLILRPAGLDTFELVGECYLHGFMLERCWMKNGG